MKRIFSIVLAFVLCFMLVSCDELLVGIGNERGSEHVTEEETPDIEFPAETWPAEATESDICVDWSDFVLVNGNSYDGYFKNTEIDESRIGERLGEILYNVETAYSSFEEMDAAVKRDFTASFRPIGCEIFAVKDDGYSIAVLDNGKYYIYTRKTYHTIPFSVFGGEEYSLPGTNETNRGVTINTFDQLCEAYGGAENMPKEILDRYSDDTLSNITLIIVELISGWGGTEFGIGSVAKMADDLFVNAFQFDSDADGDTAMHYWTFFIEIPKTDDKKVDVDVEKCEPLKNDTGMREVSYNEIREYLNYASGVDYGRYEGRAVLNKYAAEEILRGMYNYTLNDIEIGYNPTYNYWLAKHTYMTDGCGYRVYTVIRASDGKKISQLQEQFKLPE